MCPTPNQNLEIVPNLGYTYFIMSIALLIDTSIPR